MEIQKDNLEIKYTCAKAFIPLLKPARYKVFYGGRGGAKSWSFAQILLTLAIQGNIRVLCLREYENSIEESMCKTLVGLIRTFGLEQFFTIYKREVRSVTGSTFIFKGLQKSESIRSYEGINICWVEEARGITKDTWDTLIPTIRREDSEIWVSFNPGSPTDETYTRFVLNTPDDAIVRKVSWRDNPWFPNVLRKDMEYMKRVNYQGYLHIWEGEPRTISEAQVFYNKFVVEHFETPPGMRAFFHGVDWGFAKDPTVLVRAFIMGNVLYIDYELYGIGVEIDETARMFEQLETTKRCEIIADCARPEMISHLRRRRFNIKPTKKGPGSVEDGIALLKNFEKIIIHPRCKHTADEFTLYSYQVDRNTGAIRSKLVDANNHCIDALRYSLERVLRGNASIRINPSLLGGVRRR